MEQKDAFLEVGAKASQSLLTFLRECYLAHLFPGAEEI